MVRPVKSEEQWLKDPSSGTDRDRFAEATVAQNFMTDEGKPMSLPAEAVGSKAEYLEWHRSEVFGKV